MLDVHFRAQRGQHVLGEGWEGKRREWGKGAGRGVQGKGSV